MLRLRFALCKFFHKKIYFFGLKSFLFYKDRETFLAVFSSWFRQYNNKIPAFLLYNK